jgi:hypothetical protein
MVLLLLACAGAERRFPLREPLWRDSDLAPVTLPCAPRPTSKDPRHVACAPEPYISPLAWDGLDNSIFRPLVDVFAVDPAGPAWNVNALDEVADSAWFSNRLGMRQPSRDELLAGACRPEDLLDGEHAAPGSWQIDQGKPNGASAGFRIRVAGKAKFMLKTDILAQPERPTAASAIGAAIYHAVGFNTSCEQIVYFGPAVLSLQPGLIVTDNSGVPKPFDDAALRRVLAQAGHRGPLLRMQASAWLPGSLIGPFRYEGTRADDPNDVIPHQDRRELRGGRVLAAWLHHFDAREQNTMDSWISSDPAQPDSSPGFVRHYYLDTSDSFGSEWDWDEISRRFGYSYLLDWGYLAADFVTLGAIERPWERARRKPGFELFGYFSAREFDPQSWKNEYPNPAFSRATEHDDAWMTRILSRLDRSDIEALVTLGEFTRPEHAAYLAELLERRLQRITARYFELLSPLADPHFETPDDLCLLDLARRRGPWRAEDFRYRVLLQRRTGTSRLTPSVGPAGELCVRLPHAALDGGTPPGDRSRYTVVLLDNGQARYPLALHLYDLGPAAGFSLVGLERPEAPLGEVARAQASLTSERNRADQRTD